MTSYIFQNMPDGEEKYARICQMKKDRCKLTFSPGGAHGELSKTFETLFQNLITDFKANTDL